MSIDEAIRYAEEINATVTWDKEQEKDRIFIESVIELLDELKEARKVDTTRKEQKNERLNN